jgi:hypothetical protein
MALRESLPGKGFAKLVGKLFKEAGKHKIKQKP